MKIKIKFILVMLTVSGFLISCQQQNQSADAQIKKGMIKVTIIYPNGEGKTFDMDYYKEKHMPMVASLLSESIKLYKIDKGIASGRPDEQVANLAIGYLYFDTLSEYQEAFGPNAEQILNDIPNYTNIQPVVQISEIIE